MEFIDKAPWQTVLFGLSEGDTTYIPAGLIDFPTRGCDLGRLDADGQRLLMAVALCNDFCPSCVQKALEATPLALWLNRADAWLEVPLVVADLRHGEGLIIPVLLGRTADPAITIEQGWLAPGAEEAARAALALGGCGECGFVLVPRLSPKTIRTPRDGGAEQFIDGPSLGLPLAVAARRLHNGKTLPGSSVIMTGAVDGVGRVLRVSLVQDKLRAAWENEYSEFFMYPACCSNELSSRDREGVEAIPIADFRGADALLDLCGLNKGSLPVSRLATRLEIWRESPRAFIGWLADNDYSGEELEVLLDLATEQGWFERLSDQELAQAVERMEDACNAIRRKQKPQLAEVTTQRLISFFPYKRLKALVGLAGLVSPGLYFLIQVNKTLANNRGKISKVWKKLGEHCRAGLSRRETLFQSLKDMTSQIRDLTGICHNTYSFSSEDVPTSLLEQANGFRSLGRHPDLGKVYGFLAQHMAFCGDFVKARQYAACSLNQFNDPAERSRRYVDLAYMSLEQGRTEEARQNIREAYILDRKPLDMVVAVKKSRNPQARDIWNKLCEALDRKAEYCDSADLALAVDRAMGDEPGRLFWQLCQILKLDYDAFIPERSLEEQANRFIQAAYARLLWMCGDTDREDYVQRTLPRMENRHPWQLWACNCGRLLAERNPQLALDCLERSLALCLESSESVTLHPMALLPLSVMYENQLVPAAEVLKKTQDVMELVRQHCQKGLLREAHFHDLLDRSAAGVLEAVTEKTARYFPFNYR